jgi:small-conductance mechanosensitive channel
MRYLAKVERATTFLEGAVVRLLARQLDEYLWEKVLKEKTLETDIPLQVGEGAMVLVQLDETDTKIIAAEDAMPWVLVLVEQFLSQGITPEFLAQEAERAEQWRQSLTLESQEVERRALETAARRNQIQELERNIKLMREELEQREAEISTRFQTIEHLEEEKRLT